MIRVLLVDDSPLALHLLQRVLASTPDIRVVGTALNGREALPLVASLSPDVICLDLHMPVMDGLEFTRAVMASTPHPILVVSVSVEPGGSGVFKLLEAGAVDVLPKPGVLEADDAGFAAEFAVKVRVVAGVRVFRRRLGPPAWSPTIDLMKAGPAKLAVLGASTGGPQALKQILGALPTGFPLPLVCIQHIGGEFLPEMLTWLGQTTPLAIRQARAGEYPEPGSVHFPPADRHLEFDRAGRFLLTCSPPFGGHRPSVTVSMNAAARQFRDGAVGVLLTGMGRDGADGLASIAQVGGLTIAQDEATSVVFGMPGEAVALGAARHVLPLEQIAPTLMALVKNDRRASTEN
ncbi:chemotaxis-specific protein-glutamate methyltransferase CheB [Ideonella sp. YS5]|uniref:chemotaxis-specific protein-glutamate methyltransferase CheB n=1 Tax=Ideonella sp. YS5 TaxID=3453714 RepID=UPI003EEB87F2